MIRQQAHPSHIGTGFLAFVRLFIKGGMIEESLLGIIKGRNAEGTPVIQFHIGAQFCHHAVSRASTQARPTGWVSQRIGGEKSDKTVLGIHAIQRALRATQHIRPLQIVQIPVVGTFQYDGHLIVIHAYRGTAQTRTHTTQIDG